MSSSRVSLFQLATFGATLALALASTATMAGPVIQGPILQGPILQGPIVQGPIIQGPVLQGPIIQGPVLQGPILQSSLSAGGARDGTVIRSSSTLGDTHQPVGIRLADGRTFAFR